MILTKRVPILTYKWLEDSLAKNKILPNNKYIVYDPEFEKKFKFSLKDSMNEESVPYLDGLNFSLSDRLPEIDELEELIESTGGTLVSGYKKKDDPVIICDKDRDKDLIKTLKNKWTIYNIDLILDSVFDQNLDLDKVKAKYKIN